MISGIILLSVHNISFIATPHPAMRVTVTDVPSGKVHEVEMSHEAFGLAMAVAFMGDNYALTEWEKAMLEDAFAGFPEECRFIP